MGNLFDRDESQLEGAISARSKQQMQVSSNGKVKGHVQPLKSILKNTANGESEQIASPDYGGSFPLDIRKDKLPRYTVDSKGQVRTVGDDRKVVFPDNTVPKLVLPENSSIASEDSVSLRTDKNLVVRERRTRVTKITSSITSSIEEREEYERYSSPPTSARSYSSELSNTSQFVDETLAKTLVTQSNQAQANNGHAVQVPPSPLVRSESLQLGSASKSRKASNGKVRHWMGSLSRPFKSRGHVNSVFSPRELQPMDENQPAQFSPRPFVPANARTLACYEDGLSDRPSAYRSPAYRPSAQGPQTVDPLVQAPQVASVVQHPFAIPQPQVVKVREMPYKKHQHSTGSVKLIRRKQQDSVSLTDPYDLSYFRRPLSGNSFDSSFSSSSQQDANVRSLRNYTPSKTATSFAYPTAFSTSYASSLSGHNLYSASMHDDMAVQKAGVLFRTTAGLPRVQSAPTSDSNSGQTGYGSESGNSATSSDRYEFSDVYL